MEKAAFRGSLVDLASNIILHFAGVEKNQTSSPSFVPEGLRGALWGWAVASDFRLHNHIEQAGHGFLCKWVTRCLCHIFRWMLWASSAPSRGVGR